MYFLENIISAWQLLLRNKVRSFLTMLGIIIGVMAVVVIMSVGAGAQSLILNQIKSLGSNLIGVLPGKSDDNGPPAAVYGIVITTLKYDDVRALSEGTLPHITAGTGYVRGVTTVTADNSQSDTTFVGVMGSYPQVEEITLKQGRFFTEDENRSLSRVAVLGYTAARDLFGDLDPVGKQIKIKRLAFTVIGVVNKRGTSGFQDQDDQVFVPLITAQKLLLGIDYINFARLKVDTASAVETSMEGVREVLRERHDITDPNNDDFSVRSTNQGLEAITGVTNALKFFLAAIAALSLVVGGIGIMNIMLAAVEERTREIGLRKAIGATSGNIMGQFLIETISITLTGGVIGILLGTLLSVAVAAIARNMGYQWDLVISLSSIILAVGVSVTVGLVFGLSPARRASHLSPIEALRYE
jgi:putative ABC transport system permease protein